ncbi:MAG: hypothetical protein H6853_03235 [Rhodospirillales bacterium]|nr:hypothetical protein [Alphaproteobacteria bacterium]USO04297.1 MAG: hypothetical protein H6853_03235 [Rhodospirillales bacterium]
MTEQPVEILTSYFKDTETVGRLLNDDPVRPKQHWTQVSCGFGGAYITSFGKLDMQTIAGLRKAPGVGLRF